MASLSLPITDQGESIYNPLKEPLLVITLPTCLTHWPFHRTINPFYSAVVSSHLQWVQNFPGISPNAIRSVERSESTYLVALAYPKVPEDQLKLLADLMSTFFIIDDLTDRLDCKDARRLMNIVMAALRDPENESPDCESQIKTPTEIFVGSMFRSFWSRGRTLVSPAVTHRFIGRYEAYANAVCLEATDRDESHTRNLESYFIIRRDTIGGRPCFDMLLLDLNISGEELEDARITELEDLASDMIIITNDICSYNKEQCRRADNHNIVTILIKLQNISIQESMDLAGELFRSRAEKFLAVMSEFPTDRTGGLMEYIYGLGNWVTANHEWHYEAASPYKRYYNKSNSDDDVTIEARARANQSDAF